MPEAPQPNPQPSEVEQALEKAFFTVTADGRLIPKDLTQVSIDDLLAVFTKLGLREPAAGTLRDALNALIRRHRAQRHRPR